MSSLKGITEENPDETFASQTPKVFGILNNYLNIPIILKFLHFQKKEERYAAIVMQRSRMLVSYVLSQSREICGHEDPNIILLGSSAGGGAAAAIASEFPQIKSLILSAPTQDVPPPYAITSLSEFSGNLQIIRGSNDTLCTAGLARAYVDSALNARSAKLITVPEAKHQLDSAANITLLADSVEAGITSLTNLEG